MRHKKGIQGIAPLYCFPFILVTKCQAAKVLALTPS